MKADWRSVESESPFDKSHDDYVRTLISYVMDSIKQYGITSMDDDAVLRLLPKSIELSDVSDEHPVFMRAFNTLPAVLGTEDHENRHVVRIISLSTTDDELKCMTYLPANGNTKSRLFTDVVTNTDILVDVCNSVWRTCQTL